MTIEYRADYSNKLVPRALSYATGLLNYFFRGQIEAVNFSLISGGAGTVSGATFKVKNNTPGETILSEAPGKFVVSYEYTQGAGTVYGVSNEVSLAESIASGGESTTEYSFSFPGSIPSDAQDVKYWLLFRGKLGYEDDAVVANIVNNPWVDITDSTWWDPFGTAVNGTYSNGIWSSGPQGIQLWPPGYNMSPDDAGTAWWDEDAWAKDLRFTKFRLTYTGSPDWMGINVGCDGVGPGGVEDGDLFYTENPADLPSGVDIDVTWLPPHCYSGQSVPNDFNTAYFKYGGINNTGRLSISKFEIYVPHMTNNLRQWIKNHVPVYSGHDNIVR